MTDEATRVALVTGAARGLGTEIARQLLDRGLTVLAAARDLDAATRICGELGPGALPLQLDVTKPASVASAVTEALRTTGRVDALINNAGITDGDHRADRPDFGLIGSVLDTNLLGVWRMCEAVLPHMRAAGYGRIVNLTSNLGSLTTMSSGTEPAYRVSKAALNALTRVLAADLAGTGILVNAASPGWTRTDMGGPRAPRSVEEGARTAVRLATLPEQDTTTGCAFFDGEPMEW